LLRQLAPCDLVLVEGFKSEGSFPRIEVRRTTNTELPIFPHDPNVVAIAADHEVDTGTRALPVLDLNNVTKIAAFVDSYLRLG
jgi:molybdopterin-guanine dinucleotide biosynthesis protein B